MIRFLTAAVCIVAIVVGCSADPRTWFHRDKPEAPPTAAQVAAAGFAAEAGAGCEAIARGYVQPDFLPEVATGAGGFVRATAGKARIPAPTWTVDRIASEPTAYRQAGEKAERVANGTQLAFVLKAGAIALGGIVLALGRSGILPGPWGMLANAGFSLIAPYRDRKTDEAAHGLLAHVSAAFAGPTLPPDQAAAVSALLATLPPKVAAAMTVARDALKLAAALPPTAPPA